MLQASPELLMLLHEKGILQDAQLSPTHAASAASSLGSQKQPARASGQTAALSPAGPGAAPLNGPQGHHALKQKRQVPPEQLIPLLQRCA